MIERIVPFKDLSTQELSRVFDSHVNWTLTTGKGKKIEDWAEISDPNYGTIRHVAVINDERGTIFDKVDLDWNPAAFVVVYRENNDRVEFLIPKEKRMLVKNEQGEQGKMLVRNIPQGLIKIDDGESAEQAAFREVKEETGLEPINILPMGHVLVDAANSQTEMPYFLAEVEYQDSDYEHNLNHKKK